MPPSWKPCWQLRWNLLCIGTGDERNRDMATVAGGGEEKRAASRPVDPDNSTRPEHSSESRDFRA
jgi:hypothetical protein